MTKLQEIRTLMGMNGAEVARRIGISKQALYNYEKGRREAPYDVLLKMAKLYGVSLEALLGQKESAPAEDSRSAIVEKISRLSDEQVELLAGVLEAVRGIPMSELHGEARLRALVEAMGLKDQTLPKSE